MILEKQSEVTILEEGSSQESIGMSLDLDSAQILMQMLSKNLYSDAIGSTVRECASNALDSHRRANVDKPIIVGFKQNDHSNYEFSVEDFGTGLSHEEVIDILSKYGKSTKRNSNVEIGAMGLGFKSPLAYCSSFYFICRKNGSERKYMMYEGDETNTIDLLHETPTKECNGVKVIVPVLPYDRREFIDKIREQLAYFENVYFDVDDIDNNFTITRTEDFQISPLVKNGELHICLDNVYYPIDFSKLNIDKINFPVGLRFSLSDGLFPTPNREALRYTKESRKIILDKISKVADYFIALYNENIQECENFSNVVEYYNSSSRTVSKFEINLDVSELTKFGTILIKAPKMKGVSLLDLEKLYMNRDLIMNEYKNMYRIERNKWKECKRSWDSTVKLSNNTSSMMLYKDRISVTKKDYLKWLYPCNNYYDRKYICKKVKSYKLGGPSLTKGTRIGEYETYYDILGLAKFPKSSWRKVIVEFQSIVDSYVSNFELIDDIVIDTNWLESRAKKSGKTVSSLSGVRKVKLKGEFIGKQLYMLERDVMNKYSKQVSNTFKFETAGKIPFLVVYGGNSDADLMDKLFGICNKAVKFVVLSDRELKNLNSVKIQNWMPIATFMKGESKPFKRIITAHIIENLIYKYKSTFNFGVDHLANISTDLTDKITKLNKYYNKYKTSGNSVIYEAMLEVAETNDLFDKEIHYLYKEVKETLDRFYFINSIFDRFPRYGGDEKLLKVMKDMFKYSKKRIDWENYNVILNEEPLEEALTEESIEELVTD